MSSSPYCVECDRPISDMRKAFGCVECKRYCHATHAYSAAHVYYKRKYGKLQQYRCKLCVTRLLDQRTPWMATVSSSSASLVKHSLPILEYKMSEPELQTSPMCVNNVRKSFESSSLIKHEPIDTYGPASTQYINDNVHTTFQSSSLIENNQKPTYILDSTQEPELQTSPVCVNNVRNSFQSSSLIKQEPIDIYGPASTQYINDNVHTTFQSSALVENNQKPTYILDSTQDLTPSVPISFGSVQMGSNKRTWKKTTDPNNGRGHNVKGRVQIIENNVNVMSLHSNNLPFAVRQELKASALERELRVTAIALEQMFPDVRHVKSLPEYAVETYDVSLGADNDVSDQEDVELIFSDSILCNHDELLMDPEDICDILSIVDYNGIITDTTIDRFNAIEISETDVIDSVMDMEAEAVNQEHVNIVTCMNSTGGYPEH